MSDLRLATNSLATTARSCLRKYRLTYIDKVSRLKRDDTPTNFGTQAHTAISTIWETGDVDKALAALQFDDPYLMAKAVAVITNYFEHYIDNYLERYEVVWTEQLITTPLINPHSGRSSRTWEMSGKMDLLAKDRMTGELILIDHKTTGMKIDDPTASYFEELLVNTQVSHYWLLCLLKGIPITAAYFDIVKKPQIRPAKAVHTVKLKKDGTPRAGQRLVDETPSEYGDRCMADLAKNKANLLWEVPRTHGNLTTYAGDLWHQLQLLRRAEQDNYYPKNPNNCYGKFGRCWAYDICNRGEVPSEHPDKYEQRTTDHPELEDDDLDTTQGDGNAD